MKELTLFLIIFHLGASLCDVPTNCSFEQTVGKWILHIGEMGRTNDINCNNHVNVTTLLEVDLMFPNQALDQHGNEGTWTMVYNQGFEINVGGRKYFAFQLSDEIAPKVYRSYCGNTFNGWSHDLVQNNQFPPKNWACFYGEKKNFSLSDITHQERPVEGLEDIENESYGIRYEYVRSLNDVQDTWRAAVYEEYENMTIKHLVQRAGGRKSLPRIKPTEISEEVAKMVKDLPESFDWRNKSNVNFVTPVRNQGKCGSCYAFASMAQIEAGVAIQSNGRIKPVLSTQNIVSCSQYSQGCEGGFPYLIAGMYSQDFGDILDTAYPYTGKDTQCHPLQTSPRIYTSEYGYVGGFYGGCNEALMRLALVKYGPLSVGILVSDDFLHYKGGIYQKTNLPDNSVKFNPLEATNHAVLVVGYGVDVETGMKYWTVKNSWGEEWGENGYFRIVRGTDEIAIESLAVYAVPYLGH